MVNSTIDGNSNSGVLSSGSPVEIRNSILSNNRIGVELLTTSGMTATIIADTTFWENGEGQASQRAADSSATVLDPTVAWPGEGNLVADPRYASPTDRHLAANSPCIDSGGATLAPDHDLDGNGRPVDGDGLVDAAGAAFDRGAYEVWPRGAGNGGAPGGANGGGGGPGGTMATGGAAAGATGAAGSAGGANGAVGGGGETTATGGGTMVVGAAGAPGGANGGGGGGGRATGVGGDAAPAGANGAPSGPGGTKAIGVGGHGGAAGQPSAGSGMKSVGFSCAAGGEGLEPWRALAGVALALALARRSRRRCPVKET